MATLEERVNRIYAALEGIREEDLTRFPPKVVDEYGVVQIWLDFRGGMTDAELDNAVHILVLNVAHILDHLRKWAGKDKAKRSKIDTTANSCQPFLIIKDLCNNDKHGYPPGRSWSGLAPQLRDVKRPARATTQAVAGSVAGFEVDLRTGKMTTYGMVDVIITGTVVDAKGNPVGDFYDLATEAVDMIEGLAAELGISACVICLRQQSVRQRVIVHPPKEHNATGLEEVASDGLVLTQYATAAVVAEDRVYAGGGQR